MDLKQDYLLKITTSMPTQASPGAGLVCLRPSIGSKIKTVICTPAQGDINHKHFDKNMSFVRFNASKLNIKALSKLNKRLNQIIDNILLFYTCITNFKDHKPKLIICYGVLNFLGSYFFSRFLSTKLILSLHNSTDVEKIKKFPFLKKLVIKCDGVWVCSYELSNQVMHEFGIEPFYRPTGFDPEEFYPLNDSNRHSKMKLISVGSFKWKKNFKTLISAFKLLSDKLPDLTLSLIGGGELESDLRQQAVELNISKKVKFLGVLSQDKIANELNNSSLFVLPSLAEGRPKVVAEALATGLPCIVSDACSCNDIVKNAGISIKEVSPQTIFDAVMQIMNNPASWEDLSRNAQLNIKSSSWKEISYLEQQHINNIISKNI